MGQWQIKQIEKLSDTDPGLVDDMLLHLQEFDPDRHKKLVIGAYLDRDISLGKAAEMLGLHSVELRQQFLKKGIPIHIGSESIEELQSEITAAEEMRPKR